MKIQKLWQTGHMYPHDANLLDQITVVSFRQCLCSEVGSCLMFRLVLCSDSLHAWPLKTFEFVTPDLLPFPSLNPTTLNYQARVNLDGSVWCRCFPSVEDICLFTVSNPLALVQPSEECRWRLCLLLCDSPSHTRQGPSVCHIENINTCHQFIVLLTPGVLWPNVQPRHIDLSATASHGFGSWYILINLGTCLHFPY